MNGYFRPLRRKVGVLTLVMACVFLIGWIRSRGAKDLIIARSAHSIPYYIASNLSEISISRNAFLSAEPTSGIVWHTQAIRRSIKTDEFEGLRGGVDWQLCGFRLILHPVAFAYVLPYWSIVTPLTLLSAWLLLSKPRSKPAATQPTVDATSRQNAQDAI